MIICLLQDMFFGKIFDRLLPNHQCQSTVCHSTLRQSTLRQSTQPLTPSGRFFFRCAFMFYMAFLNQPLGSIAADSRAPLTMVYDRGSMTEVYKDSGAAKVKLSDLKSTEHLYAIGPLSKLRGEILIWDSVPYEARVSKGEVQVKSDWDESAAFLIWSSVPKWRKMAVPPAVQSLGLLEMWMDSMSGGVDTPLRRQYPFLIKGKFGRIQWHIVNVQDDGKPLTQEKLQAQKFHGQSKALKAELVGFFSPDHQGLFISPGRHTHIHMKTGAEGEEVIAHVDDFDPTADDTLTLYVPTR